MSRFSRFEKLETQRRPAEAKSSGTALERFEEHEPEHAPDHTAQRPRPAQPAPKALGALERFAGDEAQAIRTDDDELAKAPSLECSTCLTVGGKFETVCHACGASLKSVEARAHNLALLASRRAQSAEDDARAMARLGSEIEQAAAMRAQDRSMWEEKLRDISRAYGGGATRSAFLSSRWPLVAGLAVTGALFGTFARVPAFRFILGVLVIALVATWPPVRRWIQRMLSR